MSVLSISSHSGLGSTMMSERKCAGSVVYQVNGPDRTKFHWRRNKVNSLDIEKSATPFAMDRQFEDQRILMETNRNPRYYIPTKVDKVRSEQIIKKQGLPRPVAMKASVINKIVREASGVHNYAIVPPIKTEEEKLAEVAPDRYKDLDPDTNPFMKAYAMQAQSKPVIVSYGHRPKSANRIFHPSTMKIQMKHGEIVKNKGNKFSFGLPTAMLAAVLKAPQIPKIDALIGPYDEQVLPDPLNLFTAPTDEEEGSVVRGAILEDDRSIVQNDVGDSYIPNELSKPSWVSSLQQQSTTSSATLIKTKSKKNSNAGIFDRPEWNDGFHTIRKTNKERYALKRSGVITALTELPIAERMNRFNKMQCNENQILPWCENKQEIDKLVRQGVTVEPLKPSAVKGQTLYYDPLDTQLRELQRLRDHDVAKYDASMKEKEFQESLHSIPQVNYFPVNKLKKLVNKTKVDIDNFEKINLDSDPYYWNKKELTNAIDRARNGDALALYKYYRMDEVSAGAINKRSWTSASFIDSPTASRPSSVQHSRPASKSQERESLGAPTELSVITGDESKNE